MNRNIEDRVAIVTGAGSGIGRATALRLAADGYGVTLAGRRVDRLMERAELTSDQSRTLVSKCDVTDTEAVTAMIAATQEKFGCIDALVNNAGISRTAAFPMVSLAGWREVMAFDIESIVLVTQTALPDLLASRGSVVNVASVAGLGGDPGLSITRTSLVPSVLEEIEFCRLARAIGGQQTVACLEPAEVETSEVACESQLWRTSPRTSACLVRSSRSFCEICQARAMKLGSA